MKRLLKIILFLLIPLLIAFGVLSYINRDSPPSHAAQNQDVMKYSVDEEYVRWAFQKLESSFPDSNDILLDQYFVRTRDTLIKEEKKTEYYVFFSYYWKEHPNELYYSKIGFALWKPVMLIFNQPVAGSGLYERMSDELKRKKFAMGSY